MTPIQHIADKSGTESERGLYRLRDWLRLRCGMDYPDHKILLLKSRLQSLSDRLRLKGLDHLAELALADANSQAAALVVQVASTNHTFFYREVDVLEAMVSQILLELRSRDDIRIWSAAASSGEEAYTVAIMLAEALGLEAARRRIAILGTDISAHVVAEAERGVYTHSKLENVDHGLLQKYFKPVAPGQLGVSPDIKALCTFRRLNLKARPWPFRRPFDVVLCRNVLYYFERPDQIATLEAIYEAAAPHGWLITSVTETLRSLGTAWSQVSPESTEGGRDGHESAKSPGGGGGRFRPGAKDPMRRASPRSRNRSGRSSGRPLPGA